MRVEAVHGVDVATLGDGRRRKGEQQRRRLLEATLAVVAEHGLAGVSQRRVAEAAGVPPATVLYHYETVDALLSATLVMVNTSCVEQLRSIPDDEDPLPHLAAFVSEWGDQSRPFAVAELELYGLAARVPAMRGEMRRWWAALDEVLARSIDDPSGRHAARALVDGLCLESLTGGERLSSATVQSLLERLRDHPVTRE